jgi:hypothetical protein
MLVRSRDADDNKQAGEGGVLLAMLMLKPMM